MNEDSSAGIVTRLYARHPINQGLISDKNKKFVSFQNGPDRLLSQSSQPCINLLLEDVFMRGVKWPVVKPNFPTRTAVGNKNLDSSLRFHGMLSENALHLIYPSRITKHYLTLCDESAINMFFIS